MGQPFETSTVATLGSKLESLITTILPTYRRPAMLRRAIASVLSQTYRALQVCVYDNAADAETASVVRSFGDPRLQYIPQPTNIGACANFQSGLSRVATPYFSFLADDDVLLPAFYETALQALEAQPTAMFVALRVILVDGNGTVLSVDGAHVSPGVFRPPDGLVALLDHGHINWTGLLFRREAISIVDALDPQTAPSFDLDFELRLAARCAFVVRPEAGALMVHHKGSTTVAARLSDTWPAFLKIIENVAGDPTLLVPVRRQVRSAMESQLAGRLFRIGRAAARQGNVGEADQAARLISERYGWRGRARLLQAMARVCAAIPATRPALGLGLEGYRRLHSWQLRSQAPLDYGQWIRA